jgi:hypothetical protein
VFNYLIRVRLPDRPGALGAVASRIGSVGGDVVSIDILQRQDGIVVDELGVGLAGDNLIDLLRDEILEVDGVSIESIRVVDGEMPDRDTELLDVAEELFKQTSRTELLEHLVARVRRGLAASFAAVVEAGGPDVVICDGEPPDDGWLGVLDGPEAVDGSPSAPGEGVELVVTPMVRAGKRLVVGRNDPVLRNRERRWISTMADLADFGWRDLG